MTATAVKIVSRNRRADMSHFSVSAVRTALEITPSMQLCLVNNDPGSTLLTTPEGEPLFSIETLPLAYTELGAPSSCSPKCMTTTVKRIERYQSCTGHVETSIGVIEFCGPTSGAHLLLCGENHKLDIEPPKRKKLITAPLPEKSQGEEEGQEKCVSFLHQIPTFIHLVHQFLGIYRARLPTVQMANVCSVTMGMLPDINNKSSISCFNILVFCTAILGGQQLYASGPIPLC
jgi:hypothetical protein